MPESPAPTGRREAPPSVPVARSPIIPERAAPEKSEEKPTSPASGSGFLGRTQPPESPLASPSSTPAPPRETKVEDKAEAVSSPTTLPPRRAPFPVTASPASEANAPVTEAFSLDEAKKPDAATPPPNANARPAFSAMRPSMGRPMGEETGDKLEDKGQTSSAHPSLRPEKVDIDDLANAADDVSTAATYRDRLLSRRQPIKSESISLDGPEASASQDNETPSSPPRSAVFFDRRRESPSPETVTEAKPIGVFAPARPSDADKPSDEAKVAGNGQTEAKPEMPIAPARPRGLVFETPSTAPIGRERPTAPPSLPEKPVLISEKATPEAQEKVPPSVESSTLPEKAEDRLATAAAATLAAVQTAQAVKEETPAKVEKVEAPAIEAHKPKPIEQKRPAPPTTPPTSVFDPPRGSKEARAALAAEPIPEGGRWICPNYMELLQQGSTKEIDDQVLIERARIIEDTLNSFGASGKVVEINSGPVITQFGVEPDYNEKRGGGRSRVKVSAIAALEKDIALALAAKTIRIEAPVPGKGYVGIEVPNSEAALVSLRDVMMSEQHKKLVEKSKLAIGLGKRVDGTPLSADLTQMPHLLIAGTTGSGKSVCVNAIISCLLMQNTPDELQIIMVDPKRVELAGYNGIPHLVAPVVVDLERIVGVLKWVQREMDDRYKRFAATSARNITDFNRKQPEGQPKMPYLVVIVDELADLMMLAPDETERLIARLAQMARATGIHLIISTQRPSVDVVTGLIKANFPARVAFAVASSVDSRVILDQPGAEKLLGRGDMLYQAPDAAAPYRMQGVYLSDAEINTITNYWKGPRALRSGATRPEAKIDLTSAPLSVYTPPAIPTQARSASSPSSIVIRRVQDDSKLGGASKGQDKLDDDGLWDEDEEDFADIEDDEDFDGESDSLYDNAVELVKSRKKASISMLQRHFRIGYVRAARLIDLMEQNGVVGPAETGAKPRRVNTTE
jgi:S-DNA-T family DNA segregation ATPase FtsK/SpoIIIE